MICPNCNNNTDENAKFCVNCGYNLSKVDIANNNINNGTLASDSISTVSSNNSSFTNDSMNIANNNTLTNGNIETTSSSNNTYMNGEMNKKTKKGHKGLIITIIIILILAIAGVSAFLLLKDSDKDSDNKEVNNTETKNTNNTGNTNNGNTNNGNNNNGNSNNGNNNNGNSNNNNSGKNNNTANSFVTDFDNYNIELEMNMTINGMEMITTATGTVDQVNQKEYLDMKMSVMGMNVDMEAYTDYKSGITYMTEPFTNNWTKQTGASQTVDLNNILNLLTSMNNVTKIDNNHYKVKISPNEMQGLLATSDVDTSIISGDIEADVYVENGYIKELDYDFTNMIDGFDKFTVKMKISNYDKAGNVTIPNDVIKNATEA